jgi:blue copper oxidase
LLTRRELFRAAATAGTALAGGVGLLLSCREHATEPGDPTAGSTLLQPGTLPPVAALVAKAEGSGWFFNGSSPGPTFETRAGDVARIAFRNELPEPMIVHWHGGHVPPEADGHPRDAIPSHTGYEYTFPIAQRAATLWYHPHPHERTAAQIHRGLAGFFLIRDAEEDALKLPRGSREVLVMLQDRDESARPLDYAPTDADLHLGFLRGVVHGNGVARPSLRVSGATYRFRILNASNARVYLLGLEGGAPLTVIGNDGGLLPAPVEVDQVYLGVSERIDILISFAALPIGQRLLLKSLPFPMLSPPGSAYPQGMEMDVLECVRVAAEGPGYAVPATLSSITPLGPATVQRQFQFTSPANGPHRINGLAFDMHRVDYHIPMGQVERWTFLNNSNLPHPVHVHGTHFQVVSRTGGRGVVFPYEQGWKDTVLTMPFEAVEVLIRFDYRGVFPLHCHNLEHEDSGMMLNLEVT